MSDKPNLAIYWFGACGGCDSAILDLGASLQDLKARAEIVLWPAALDFKHDRLQALPDRSLDLTVISGCVRNSEHRKMAELLRAKSRTVLACGACACFGGTPGLANLRSGSEIVDWVYRKAPTVVNPAGCIPDPDCQVDGEDLPLPEFYDHVYSLGQVIEVDYFLPGCPPPVDLLSAAINTLLGGDLPELGSTLAPCKPLCDACDRNRSKPLRFEIDRVYRSHTIDVPADDCFLAHGVICLGPATRSGCGGSCLAVNAPCRGCFGPVDGVTDAGVRFLSSFASLLAPADDEERAVLIASIADPAGYAHRFTQAVSILGRRELPDDTGGES